jgi:hypothetical protein
MGAYHGEVMNNRRKLVIALGAGALTAPFTAFAQPQGKVWRIGVLETISMALNAANFDAFRNGMRELGYVEGKNLVIEYRSADGTGDVPAEGIPCRWGPYQLRRGLRRACPPCSVLR